MTAATRVHLRCDCCGALSPLHSPTEAQTRTAMSAGTGWTLAPDGSDRCGYCHTHHTALCDRISPDQ